MNNIALIDRIQNKYELKSILYISKLFLTLIFNFSLKLSFKIYIFEKYKFIRRNFIIEDKKFLPLRSTIFRNYTTFNFNLKKYTNDIKSVMTNHSNPFSIYKKIINNLNENENIFISNANELNFKKNKINVILRHDVDACIHTAVKMADYLGKKKINGIFFLLNSSQYFSRLILKDKFQSNFTIYEQNHHMLSLYKKINNKYTKLGLHIDPFLYYKNKVNFLQIIKKDIKWFDQNNIKISKVFSSHNSYLSNGAEGFEIFDEYSFRKKKIFQNK